MNRPFLTGRRLYLRPMEEPDITEEYLRWLNDPEVTRYLGVGREPVTLESVHRYVRRFQSSDTDLLFAIIDRETNRQIGTVTLNHIHPVHRTANTGLMIGNKAFWGRWYASETLTLLIDYAFSQLGLHKVIAGVVTGNAGILAVLKRLGFHEEGVLRQEFFLEGQHLDTIRMGLLQHEFRKRGAAHRPDQNEEAFKPMRESLSE